MNNGALITWIIIMVVLVVIELFTLGLTTIWFAGGALVGAVLALFHAPISVQVIAALVVSIVLLFTTRPLARKKFNSDRTLTNVESLIGKKAIVISDIDNLKGCGQAKISGQEWSAKSVDDALIIEKGTTVEICEVSGVKLIVKPVE